MSHQTNYQQRYLFLHLIILLVISGCGGGSSSERSVSYSQTTSNELHKNTNSNSTDSDSAENQITHHKMNVQKYENANLQLSYPEDWILNTENEFIVAQFFEPNLDEQQGQNNCILMSTSVTSRLMDGVNEFLLRFNVKPKPQISFVNINGTAMARVAGTLSSSEVTVDSIVQIAAKNQMVHSVLCGGTSPEEFELIFNSMTIK